MDAGQQISVGRLDQLKQLEHSVACLSASAVTAYVPLLVLRAASRFGDYGLSATAAVLLVAAGIDIALCFVMASGAALLIQSRLKAMCARVRPCSRPGGPPQRAPIPDPSSFPSGHTLHAVLVAVVVAAHLPALGLVFIPLAVTIGLSRVVLGVHYPTDVLAGGAIGGLLGFAVNLACASL